MAVVNVMADLATVALGSGQVHMNVGAAMEAGYGRPRDPPSWALAPWTDRTASGLAVFTRW